MSVKNVYFTKLLKLLQTNLGMLMVTNKFGKVWVMIWRLRFEDRWRFESWKQCLSHIFWTIAFFLFFLFFSFFLGGGVSILDLCVHHYLAECYENCLGSTPTSHLPTPPPCQMFQGEDYFDACFWVWQSYELFVCDSHLVIQYIMRKSAMKVGKCSDNATGMYRQRCSCRGILLCFLMWYW